MEKSSQLVTARKLFRPQAARGEMKVHHKFTCSSEGSPMELAIEQVLSEMGVWLESGNGRRFCSEGGQ